MAYKSIIGATCACLVIVSFNVSSATIRPMTDSNFGDMDSDTIPDRDDVFPTYVNIDNDGDGFPDAVGSPSAWPTITSVSLGGPYNTLEGVDLNVSVSFDIQNIIDPWGQLFFDLGASGSQDGFWVGDMSSGNVLITIPASFLVNGNWDLNTVGNYQLKVSIYNSSAFTIGTELVTVSSVPVPAAVWLFGSGLIGLIGLARRKA